MLISPPFLSNHQTHPEPANWLDTAMPGDPLGHGKFPVSLNLGWHGGIHLEAPFEDGARLPVRAIADGTVVYIRQPLKPNDDHQDPLNYGNADGFPVWTSNGCVIIRHATEIGASAQGQATQVVFYSVYLHLYSIKSSVALNHPIYRKDEIGQAGHIYGDCNLLHFEIICDDANLQLLVGRANGELPVDRKSVV